MAEYKFDGQSNLVWGETFKMGSKTPAIANRIFDTYANALAFANDVSAKGTAIPGLQLSVFADTEAKKNGIYRIVSVATAEGANDAVLEMVGSGNGSITAETYTDALALATADNIGQIIYAKKDDPEAEVGTSGATAGPYIVTGEGTIAKLGTTSASGDIQGDVNVLKGEVGTLQNDVEDIEDDIENLTSGVTSIKEEIGDNSSMDTTKIWGAINTLNADSGTTGSVDQKIAEAISKLPEDMFVESGRVETVSGKTYLVLTIKGGQEVWIPADKLVDTYTGDDYIQVKDYKISLNVDKVKEALEIDSLAKKDDLEALSGSVEVIEDKVDELVEDYNALAEALENADGTTIKVGAGLVDEEGTEISSAATINETLQNVYDKIGDVKESIEENAVKAGDYIEVNSGSTVSVKVSSDEGNLIKAGTDNGLFAGLYYECYDNDDLEATKTE